MFRLLVMLFFLSMTCSSLSISHWELELANKTCGNKSSCEQNDSSNSRNEEIDWRDRNCQCDKLCANYGDCCPDSKYFDVSEQRRGLASFNCVDLREFRGIYMKTSCPPDWTDISIRTACEMASEDVRDPLVSIPATSRKTGITYRNLYCSLCHREEDLNLWHPRIECPYMPGLHNLSRDDIVKQLEYRPKEELWGLNVSGRFHACGIDPVLPESSAHIVRRCQPNVIKTCTVNWTNQDVRARCEAYTSLVYDGDKAYRNPHCAMCNNIPLQLLLCDRVLFRFNYDKDFSPAAFSVLFDLSSTVVGKTQLCHDDELYDPFFKRCRAVLAELKVTKPLYVVEPTADTRSEIPTSDVNIYTVDNATLDYMDSCSKFVLEIGEFVFQNGSVFVPQYRKTFSDKEFVLRDDGRVEICAGSLGIKLVNKFSIYLGYVTFAGLGISIIFLILHLAAFSLVSELRNLSGKNLASLCISLLVAYSTFMAGQVLQGLPCFIVAIITFYSFLASFMWMLTMAFDVWRTLRLATAELRVSAGKQWRKFTIYSLWSWLAPFVIVAGAVYVELIPEGRVPSEWRPDFGVNSCWFGHSKPLLAFFAGPLAIIMFMNIAFFASSAHMIYSTTSTTRFTASASTQRDFRLYIRLAVVMGLTWTMGLVAGTLDIEALWYVFVALNTLQGLFIFLAFTCTDKVIRGLAVRHTDDKPLRPPSFSWSSDSTRKSHIGSDQGTTDTLY
ncbi:hypothetical protein O3M35_000635 [Rhynocoris fuscipes]|uniref:G-protein coupled receptors family 2 profile 2 domain-containing protein n=1 Tax=Rhynocoris fuscipes TaxID=488301 RepID=A0AAW1DQ88_9HEMI